MKAGRTFVGLMVVVGAVGAYFNGSAIYSRLLYSGVLLAFFAWAWTRWVGRGLALERSSRELRANVGDLLEENIKLTNKGRLPAPWIEVFNRTAIPFAAGSRLFTLVSGKRTRSYAARTWLTRRGGFPLGPTRVTTGDPFGLFVAGKEFPATETLIVFPMIHKIPAFHSPPGMLTGGAALRKKSPDITPHASGAREYVSGDAMKRIHWPTSARRNKLMVKEFEQDPQAQVWLYLDSQRSVHHEKKSLPEEPASLGLFTRRPKIELPPSTLEYAVSVAASLAHYFIRQRRAVGFASAGQGFTVIPAERSERQEAKILETLAFVGGDGDLSIAGLVAAQSPLLPHGSSVILITPTTRLDLLQAVDELLLRLLRPVVVLLDAKTFGGPPGAEELVEALRERRAPVILVPCGANLPQALSEISSNFKPQDFYSWQSSPLASLT